jgi:hypothetical protein
MYVKEISHENVDLMNMIQDNVQWWAFLTTVTNPRILREDREFTDQQN